MKGNISQKNLCLLRIIYQSEFAYVMVEGPSYAVLKLGEVTYLLKCKPVDVKFIYHIARFSELLIIYNNQTLFIPQKTHILQKYETEIDCYIS